MMRTTPWLLLLVCFLTILCSMTAAQSTTLSAQLSFITNVNNQPTGVRLLAPLDPVTSDDTTHPVMLYVFVWREGMWTAVPQSLSTLTSNTLVAPIAGSSASLDMPGLTGTKQFTWNFSTPLLTNVRAAFAVVYSSALTFNNQLSAPFTAPRVASPPLGDMQSPHYMLHSAHL